MKAKSLQIRTEATELLRTAASFGPGHRGNRQNASPKERAMLRDDLEALGLDPPQYLTEEQVWVDRSAKLFEAGSYPDKGIEVSTQDLERLTKNFDLPVPVLIEHGKSPLDIGYLTSVQVSGNDLIGTIALTKEANDLIDSSGAKALSLGLSADLLEIQEVSLVKNPRIRSAQIFTGEVFTDTIDWKSAYDELLAKTRTGNVINELNRLVTDEKLVPAQIPFAEALLGINQSVQFNGESQPIATLVLALIESAPKVGLFRELAPSGPESSPLHPDERAFYDRYFSGLSLEEIAKNRPEGGNQQH